MRLCKSWNDISIRRADMLKDLDSIEDTNLRLFELVKTLNLDNDEISFGKFFKYVSELEFYKDEVPDWKVEKNIELGKNRYKVCTELGDINFSQYVDFRNYAKDAKMVQMLSCAVIPDGKEYGDYDLDAVRMDIYDNMSIVQGKSIIIYMQKLLNAYQRMFPNIYNTYTPTEEDIAKMGEDAAREIPKNTGFMSVWWSLVMVEKVINYTKLDYYKVFSMNLVEFSNIYSYVLDKEKLEDKIRNEALKKYKNKK